jgi:hypothetical protein
MTKLVGWGDADVSSQDVSLTLLRKPWNQPNVYSPPLELGLNLEEKGDRCEPSWGVNLLEGGLSIIDYRLIECAEE